MTESSTHASQTTTRSSVPSLTEGLFSEILHPRGRTGEWVTKPEAPHGAGLSFTGHDYAKALDGFSHSGLIGVLSPRTQTTDKFAEVWLNIVRPGDPTPVGLLRTKLLPPDRNGKRAAEFSNMYMREAEQHNGYGAAVTSHMVDVLRANHVDSARVEAVSVGSYAWTKLGFHWEGDVASEQQRMLADAKKDGRWAEIVKHAPSEQVAEFERKIKAGEFTAEAEVAAWGRQHTWPDGRGVTWIGKSVMVGGHWHGTLDLRAGAGS